MEVGTLSELLEFPVALARIKNIIGADPVYHYWLHSDETRVREEGRGRVVPVRSRDSPKKSPVLRNWGRMFTRVASALFKFCGEVSFRGRSTAPVLTHDPKGGD